MWDEITNPFTKFNGATVDVWEWKKWFLASFCCACDYSSMMGFKLIHVSKRALGPLKYDTCRVKNNIRYIIIAYVNCQLRSESVCVTLQNSWGDHSCIKRAQLGTVEANTNRSTKSIPAISLCLCGDNYLSNFGSERQKIVLRTW